MATPVLVALEFTQIAAPGAAASGTNRLFFESDGNLYMEDSSGAVVQITQKPRPETKDYSVSGVLAVPTSGVNFLPGFMKYVPTGFTCKLIGVRAVIRAGTSCTFKVQQNGSDVTGLTGIAATPTAGDTTLGTAVSVSDGDLIAPVVTAISGTPDGLSIAFKFQVTG